MFGSFVPEQDGEKINYGIVKNLGSFNILWAAVHEWVGIAKDVWRAPTLAAKWNYMAKPPGWSHDNSRDTSETIKARWHERQAQKPAATAPAAASEESGEWQTMTSSSSEEGPPGAPSPVV